MISKEAIRRLVDNKLNRSSSNTQWREATFKELLLTLQSYCDQHGIVVTTNLTKNNETTVAKGRSWFMIGLASSHIGMVVDNGDLHYYYKEKDEERLVSKIVELITELICS